IIRYRHSTGLGVEKIHGSTIRQPLGGISVKTDGSEDDIIFDYDSLMANKENDELIEDKEFQEEDYNN
ncbi:3520_t:CDS:2, partial [Funneliformis caledonium]